MILITLPETTPVLEAEGLHHDLERAGIHPWAWVVNNSVAAADPHSRFLRTRRAERPQIARVTALARRTAIIPLLAEEPIGVERLSALTVDQRPPEPLQPRRILAEIRDLASG